MSLVSRYLDPPLLERLESLQLSARSVVEGTTTGQHRAYALGDEPRRLDWRVLARTDRPFVREYDEETNLRCAILLDRSGSMAYRGEKRRLRKFDYAAKFVASLAYLMLKQTESVGLAMSAGAGRLESWLAPHPGSGQLARVIDVLERTSPAGASDVPAAMGDLAERLGRRALAVVVSDFFVDVAHVRRALARLRHARHEAILIQILDPDEIEFPFRHWLRLRGLEGESPRLCEPALVRQRYLSAFEAHARSLHDACRGAGVEIHTFSTGKPLGETLIGFLRHRVKERGTTNIQHRPSNP
jgi:uncharacterized protein (DUF58 family)